MNLAVLVGRLARPAQTRTLQRSGDLLVAYEVTIDKPADDPDARADTVPVVWFTPPASAADLDVGERVLVVGRVRRRFFQGGTGTQSRTEVVADSVVPIRHGKRFKAALAGARDRLAGVT